MSGTVARPMPVPDLAGLLARPKRPPKAATMGDLQSQPERLPDNSATSEPVIEELSQALDSNAVVTHADLADSAAAPVTKVSRRGSTHAPAESAQPSNRSQEIPLAESRAGRQYLRTKAVQLPRSIHRQVTAEAARRGTTATVLMLTAINSTYHLLPTALRDTQPPAGGLFDVPQDRVRQEPTVQTTLRMTDAQLDAINELVAANATNRSRLFSTAIGLYLE